jgi:hypothetical protein
MKAAMGREKALSVVLVVCVLMLAGLLFWEWEQGKALERELLKMRKIPVTEVPAQNVLPEFTLPDVTAGFPDLVARNLFAFNRRFVAPPKGGVIVMKKGQFALVGVLITPQLRSALLRDVQTNKTETVALIGVIRGLTLGEVEPSRVVLRQGAESEELTLNVQVGPKRPAMPPAQVMVASVSAHSIAPPSVTPAPAALPASAPGRAMAASPSASAPSAPIKPVEADSNPKTLLNILAPLPKK